MGGIWLAKPLGHEPPTARALGNAKTCLAECEKRGFAPVFMGPSSLDEFNRGIMFGFPGRFAMEFMNNGDVWLTFKTRTPRQPGDVPDGLREAKAWRIQALLWEIAKDGIAQPLPKGREMLVSWPIERSADDIRGALRLVRDAVLGRVDMPGFLRRLAPSKAEWLDNFGERE